MNQFNSVSFAYFLHFSGKQKSGKSTVCKRIIDRLSESPFHCHSEVFNCSKNKGRKVNCFCIFSFFLAKRKLLRIDDELMAFDDDDDDDVSVKVKRRARILSH